MAFSMKCDMVAEVGECCGGKLRLHSQCKLYAGREEWCLMWRVKWLQFWEDW